MEWTMYLFLLATLPGTLAANRTDMHFAGGSIMFEFINTTKVKITTLTGWLLGYGPCGKSCSALDVGKNTTQSRQQILHMNGEAYFGDWRKEISFSDKPWHHKVYETVTNEIINHIKSQVIAVNIPMKWEQEMAEVVIDIDPAAEYTDVSLVGSYWRNYTYESPFHPMDYRLQIKLKPELRGDTKKPNNSPQVLFKPVYKILLNEATTIKLATKDPDGDIVRCQHAEFVEAGGLARLKNTVVNPDCSIVIDAQEAAGYVDGGWGAIPVIIMDIPKNPELDPLIPTHLELTVLSAINVQFMIQTLLTINGPEFVSPTEESQHEFNVYVGSTLKIPLYAKPTNYSSRDIKSFQLKSLPVRSFPVDVVKDDTARGGERVKYAVTKWRPGKSDIGDYLISALVIDTQGLDGLDRNYHVLVKDVELMKPNALPNTGPYFSLFPHASGIVCTVESTCFFPIYTNTRTPSGIITSVKYTTSTFPITLISEPEPIIQEGTSMFVTDVTVQASKGGEQSICFKATDNQWKTSEIKCLVVQVKLKDPCLSNPCGNGVCRSQGQSYVCNCNFEGAGKHCEKEFDFCASMPCLNNGTCIPHGYFYTCNCQEGYIGRLCETAIVHCKLGTCGLYGVCKDRNGGFECDCYSGYTGDTCNITAKECKGVVCKNGGICIAEEQNGVCICPLGFSGIDCSTRHSTTQVNGGTGENPFMVPSLTNGAQLKCFVGRPCLMSLYSKTPLKGSPDIKVGLHSSDVSASIMSTKPDPATGTVKSILSVTPNKTGIHNVCVNSGSLNPDTLCFKFDSDMYKGFVRNSHVFPHFKVPTPPDRSIINCIRGKPCHTIITTAFNVLLKKCTLYAGSTSAFVLKVLNSSSICETNVLFNPPNTSDSEVCLYAGPSFEANNVSFQGERRCFLLKTAETDFCNPSPCSPNNGGACILQPGDTPSYQCICPHTATGERCQFRNPCLNKPCKNGGFCEAHGDTYDCKCQFGFQGHHCDPFPSTTEAEFTEPTLNNGATVECEVGAKCLIPVFLRGPSAQLFDGPSNGNIDVNLWKRIGKDGALYNEDLLEVTPQESGNMKVCLKTQTIFSSSYQVICYHIRATRGVIGKQNDGFKTPTLPAATTIPCAKTKRCHIIMFSQPDQNKCQQVEGQGDLNVHIFPTKLEGGSCVTDVLFSSDSATGLDDLCLRVGPHPQRCYKVDPNPAEPCKNQTCGDGACIVEGDNSTCVYDGKHQVPGCTDETCVPIIG